MEFKLNVPERMTLLGILPQKENFINLKIIDEAGKAISLSDAEVTDLEVKQEGEVIKFDAKKGAIEKTINIGERAYTLICEALEKLDKKKDLAPEQISVYEKFVERDKK